MKSNTTYILALAVGVILVTGALTLPLAFDDHHMADAKKKKSKKYHGKKQKVEFENESGHGGAGGNGGKSTAGAGGSGVTGNGGASVAGNGGTSGRTWLSRQRRRWFRQPMVEMAEPVVMLMLLQSAETLTVEWRVCHKRECFKRKYQ